MYLNPRRTVRLLTLALAALLLVCSDELAHAQLPTPPPERQDAVRRAIKRTFGVDAIPDNGVFGSLRTPNRPVSATGFDGEVAIEISEAAARERNRTALSIAESIHHDANAAQYMRGTVPIAAGGEATIFSSGTPKSIPPGAYAQGIFLCGWNSVRVTYNRPSDSGDPQVIATLAAEARRLVTAKTQQFAQDLVAEQACDAPSGQYDLTVKRVEVVQVVQSEDNQVPLVAGKSTVARVFVGLGAGAKEPLAGVTARLHGYRNGQEMRDSPIRPLNDKFTAPLAPARDTDTQSLNFLLPIDWVKDGALTLIGEVMPPDGMQEKDTKNNDKTVEVHFSTRRELTISYLRVCYQQATNCPSAAIERAQRFMSRIYPVADDGLIYESLPVDKWVWTKSTLTTPIGIATFQAALRQRYELTERSDHARKQLMAWLPYIPQAGTRGSSDPIWAGRVGHVTFQQDMTTAAAASSFPTIFADAVPAHEVGHNLGLRHTNTDDGCSAKGVDPNTDWPYKDGRIHEVGFDPSTKKAVPDGYFDVMTYCLFDTSNIWISVHDYLKLFNGNFDPQAAEPGALPQELYALGGAGGFPRGFTAPAQAQPGSREYLVITGTAKRDGSGGRLESVYRITSSVEPEAPSRTGNHCIRLAAGSTAVPDYCFALSFRQHPSEDELDEEPFTVRVPAPAGVTKVSLMRGNRELAAHNASKSAPTVSVTSPKAGDSWSGERAVEWTAADADGDKLSYVVQYSPDGGKSWYPLDVDGTEPRLTVNTAGLASGDQVFFRVLASDGLNTTTTQVGPMRIEPPKGSNGNQMLLMLGLVVIGILALGGGMIAVTARHRGGRRSATLPPPAGYAPSRPAARPVPPAGPQPPLSPDAPYVVPARLIVLRGPAGAGQAELRSGPVTIGREPESSFRLDGAGVSRFHARVDWHQGFWVLTDLNSRNGTYVNGVRVARRPLYPGDEVRLGECVLRFELM